ncbi:MAG: endonuclease III [Rickettsiales bacterium]|jgi:endonuclease-3|nr:endonuclease III [Rickettsiales bacterium]
MISRANFCRVLEYLEGLIGRRATELYYANPFTFAVAVILSAQMTDKGVNRAAPGLFAIADTPEKMVALGLDGIRERIRSINFYNNKAKSILALSERLVKDFKGELPLGRDVLETLPGIGRKSANVIMNEMAGAPTIGVDTHVLRLSQRLGFAPRETSGPLEVEASLERLTPRDKKPYVSNWLVLFGRYHCKAKRPDCVPCGLKKLCRYYKSSHE